MKKSNLRQELQNRYDEACREKDFLDKRITELLLLMFMYDEEHAPKSKK